jgi:hypothetical protein
VVYLLSLTAILVFLSRAVKLVVASLVNTSSYGETSFSTAPWLCSGAR